MRKPILSWLVATAVVVGAVALALLLEFGWDGVREIVAPPAVPALRTPDLGSESGFHPWLGADCWKETTGTYRQLPNGTVVPPVFVWYCRVPATPVR